MHMLPDMLARFDDIQSIRIDAYMDERDRSCEVLNTNQFRVVEFLTKAVREDSPLKWDVIGTLQINADGELHKWSILNIGNDEIGVRISKTEYYRGMSLQELKKALDDCGDVELRQR
jgi:hypothetical protein